MTMPRPAASLEEVVAALGSGNASPQLQRSAAFIIPDLWRRQLPPGVAFRRRGRVASGPPWWAMERFKRPVVDGDWPSEFQLVRVLESGNAPAEIQYIAAWDMAYAVNAFELFAKSGPALYRRPLKPCKSEPYITLLFLADHRLEHDPSCRDPMNAARQAFAEAEEWSVDKVKRAEREAFKELQPMIEAFAARAEELAFENREGTALELAARRSPFEFLSTRVLEIVFRRVRGFGLKRDDRDREI